MITLIVIEGVLARGDDLKTAQPTKYAKALYDGLRSQTSTIALTRASHDIATWWLKREHLHDWSRILTWDPAQGMGWDQWKIDTVRQALADGWEIFGFVDSRLYVVEEVREMGVPGIGVSYPSLPPGHREPSALPRSWSAVVSTMETAS